MCAHLRLVPSLAAFARNQNGGVAMYFALALVAIVTLMGMALDFNRAINLRTSLAAAADAAALATARDPDVTPATLQARAEAFFLANMQGQHSGTNYTVAASELPDGDGVHIDVSAKINTILAGLVGIDQFTVRTQSEAVYNTTKIELAMVLDNTGSMRWNGKIQTLKQASGDMVDLLLPAGLPSENVKIGIIPFDIGVNVGTALAARPWLWHSRPVSQWRGCVGPRGANNDVNDSSATGNATIPAIYDDQTSCRLPPILPLTSDATALHNRINAMQAAGWTYIPEGLAWGWKVLSPDPPYDQGVAYDAPKWRKVLVLMTDGANTVRWTWSGGLPYAYTGVSSTVGDQKTRVLCNRIKLSGIIIYTVAFQVGSSSTRQMLEECASNPANYFDARNNAELEAAFARIGGDINNLRLSK